VTPRSVAGVKLVAIQVRQERGGLRLYRHDDHPEPGQRGKHPVQRGVPALLAHETAAQAAVSGTTDRCIRPILIEGDTVVLRWTFDYVDSRGRSVHFEELAYQRWAGDSILEEQFFYDPGQFKQHG
jgi:hypothetical protein